MAQPQITPFRAFLVRLTLLTFRSRQPTRVPPPSASAFASKVIHLGDLCSNPDILQAGIPERWMNSPAEEPKYSNPPFHSLRNSRHPPSQPRARHLVTKEGYHAVEEYPVHHLRPRCISIRWQVSIVAEVDPHRTLVNNRALRADAPTGRRSGRTPEHPPGIRSLSTDELDIH